MKDIKYLESIHNKCKNKCGWCAYCQGMEEGDIVSRYGDDGKLYDYEIDDIDSDGECISILNENAFPHWVYIMADDCIYNENKLTEDEN